MKQIEKRFKAIHLGLSPWDRDSKWVELHIKGGKLLLETNPQKGKELLETASNLIKEKLWPYPISLNKAEWNKAKESSRARLEEAQKAYKAIHH